MNILLATSEAVPFVKTGGLGDVSGALPVELSKLGHSAAVILPYYRQVRESGQAIEPLGVEFSVPIGSKQVEGSLMLGRLPASSVPVYFVRQDSYYDRRGGVYQENGGDYVDNCERFVFFSRAVLEAIKALDLHVDVIHANDWQTGLIPAYLKLEYRFQSPFDQIASLFTVHNLAYQGRFWHWDMLLTGLDWKYFNWQQMEFFGQLNLMKTGLVFADAINTVSPRYAEEIQSAPHGCGLEGVLSHRRQSLHGIINGVDYREWNPATDPHLAATYTADSFAQGKAACKAALRKELGLADRPDVPLVGFVGRLAEQKGIDLIASVLRDWARTRDVQWVILGTGDPKYQELIARIAADTPQRVAVRIDFSDPLAHKIEAAADMFLMPSRFEPCGLSQLYSFKYGTVPVVRATGGLADTVVDATPDTLAAGTASGFVFEDYTPQALAESLARACETWRDKPDEWRKLVEHGMQMDWSWTRSAQQYVALYQALLARLRQAVTVG